MSIENDANTSDVIYLDCHSTTPTDPTVLAAMLPCFSEVFGNPGSQVHPYGMRALELVDLGRTTFAGVLGVDSDEIVFTSGATESNNLAIVGAAERWRGKRQHLVTIGIEHPSVLEPIRHLERAGWRVSVVPVVQQKAAALGRTAASPALTMNSNLSWPGVVDMDALRSVLSEDTALVSVAIANHEIGVIQPLRQIADLVHSCGALLHTDATQAVGWMPMDLREWRADLVSFSGHKFYGPKGVGALYVRRNETYLGARPVRLLPRVQGGGQEFGLRSGTLNTPGIVGMAAAMRLSEEGRVANTVRVAWLRERLWFKLTEQVPDLELHGPNWQTGGPRLPHNLNFAVPGVAGETIMLRAGGVALSSGSACSSSTPGFSTVLRAIGLGEDVARSSLRIGLGRFHDSKAMDLAAERLADGIRLSRE